MKPFTLALACLLALLAWTQPGHAWRSMNRFGGETAHFAGVGTAHVNAFGGSTVHAWGGGTMHTNAYGGRTYGAYGEGVAHTYPGGATAYHPPGYPVPVPYGVYHPPVAVPYYAGGCAGCAVAAGAIAGTAIAGAAIAGAAAANPSVAVAAAPAYAMGASYAQLPSGCILPEVGGRTYYLCGNTWFKPVYGANGVYYVVIPTP
ncbi:hypothetical protein [Fundidesulfovibrio agrisoli]|uniref:hypothetical protein n=1 Tax=Fundidesulfovibrio agrisoli TaxID=2922717 RepID=UPI001FAB3944|nr:hypothetical protein [Fundidesulfovibrio agrisoli]